MNKRIKKEQLRKAENDINDFSHLFNEHEKKIKKLVSEIKELNIPIWHEELIKKRAMKSILSNKEIQEVLKKIGDD